MERTTKLFCATVLIAAIFAGGACSFPRSLTGGRLPTADDQSWAALSVDNEISLGMLQRTGIGGLSFLGAEERAKVLEDAKLNNLPGQPPPREKSRTPRHADVKLRDFSRPLRKGKLVKLKSATEAEFSKALRATADYSQLAATVNGLKNAKDCSLDYLSFILAARAEEEFPSPQAIEDARHLYARAARCSRSKLQAKALFRLSLLQIWRKEHDSAISNIEKLLSQSDGREYHARALYWRAHCSAALGDESRAAAAKAELKRLYPFSYQSILLERPSIEREDSPVLMRSRKNLKLNAAIERFEALIELGQFRRIGAEWESVYQEVQLAEPQLQLYFALLLSRSQNYIPKFRVLTSLFRNEPQMVSKEGLKLLYPRKNFDANIEKDANPRLVLSLIRQESAFNSAARSSAGALGLMQVMPATGLSFAGVKPHELLEPQKNLMVGSRYFLSMLRKFEGDAELAIAAYNAGPHRVDAWLRRYPVSDRVLFLDLIPFKETREYVSAIARNYVWYTLLDEKDDSDRQLTTNDIEEALPAKVFKSLGHS